jgi:hypothetical protein
MSTSEEFYAARDARTLAYGVDPGILSRTVGVVVGADAAGNPAAQTTALALVEQLSRPVDQVFCRSYRRCLVSRMVILMLPSPCLATSVMPSRW